MEASQGNIVVLFWLGIIDMQPFMHKLYQKYQRVQQNQESIDDDLNEAELQKIAQMMGLEQDDDYKDERENDYEELASANDEQFDKVLDSLASAFDPRTAFTIFKDTTTFQDCIALCRPIKFTIPQEDINEVINMSLNQNLF